MVSYWVSNTPDPDIKRTPQKKTPIDGNSQGGCRLCAQDRGALKRSHAQRKSRKSLSLPAELRGRRVLTVAHTGLHFGGSELHHV